MILGLGSKAPAKEKAAAAPAPSNDMIFDVDTESFEKAVVLASMDTPILVDFWAPWCGPCKQLMPVLEAAVKEAGGAVRMAKVNIDDNQELAQALRIQSVPTVFAFFKGQPVTAFAGVRPVSEIKAIIDQLTKMVQQGQAPVPGAPPPLDIPAALKAAAEALAQNDLGLAQGIYSQILQQDESNAAAYAGIIRTFISADHLDQAAQMLAEAPEVMVKDAALNAARIALDLARNKPGRKEVAGFTKALDKNPDDHQARFDLALAHFASGEKETAIDALILIIRKNRTWEEDKARKQLIQFFEALGPVDPLTLSGRRKLSTVLFS